MTARARKDKTAKGVRRSVEVAIVAWEDLLGYGSLLRETHFDPTGPDAVRALDRLQLFHQTVAANACTRLGIAVLNDGAVAFADLSPRSRSVTYDFLARSVLLHQRVNDADQAAGFPGARMIVAAGFRVRGRRGSDDKNAEAHLLRRLAAREIPCEQAVHQALRLRPRFGAVPELHANFAFTRAYLADRDGSRAGLAGPGCFIDCVLFDNPLPEWITFKRAVRWAVEGMTTEFGELESLDRKLAGRLQYRGIRSALQVAPALSPRPGAVQRFRALALRGERRKPVIGRPPSLRK
jgi:hypothetical protein